MNLKAITAAAMLTLAAGAAHATVLHFGAALKGASEVPPNATAGRGELTADLDTDTKTLTYHVTYVGLTGPATGAHFHGPAALPIQQLIDDKQQFRDKRPRLYCG